MVIDEELSALGVVLLEERVLRRVIKQHRAIRGFGLAVPHEHCYVIPRGALARIVDPSELAVDLAKLPDTVIVVAGDRDELATDDPAKQSALWRTIFHARVHYAFEQLAANGAFSPAVARERIHRIGQTEFDGIRWVLRHEHMLLPPADVAETYVEFVALYLELRHFAPDQVERTFPAAADAARLQAIVDLDIDAAACLAAARPPRAPAEPFIPAPKPEPTEPPRQYITPASLKTAATARSKGNYARAAILSARGGDRMLARADLDELVARLARTFAIPDTTGWSDALLPLAEHAAAQASLRSAAARVLHDLQTSCILAERVVKTVDVIGWALSRGKRALVRPLPATQVIRSTRRIRAAVGKLGACTLDSPADRERLSATMHELAAHAERRVRDELRPTILAALHEVRLEPHDLPERVAEKTLVDELLDRAVDTGQLTLGDLRDALSRNELKLPDLQLAELASGDPLLRMDRRLALALDGVHRRGEGYMRALQKFSSLLFGTRIGRLLTLYLLLPLLGSFAVFEGIQQMFGPIADKLGYELDASNRETLLGGAAVLFVLLHIKPARQAVAIALRWTWRVVRFLLFDVPSAIWHHRYVEWLRATRFVRFGVRPAIPAAIALAIAWNLGFWRFVIAGGVFIVAAVVMNLRWFRIAEEIAADQLVRSGRQLGRILPGIVRLTLDLFSKLLEYVERALYRVDEWLRFRAGQPGVLLVFKGVFGTLWFFIAYLVRLYVNLFVEPTVNPIKHFPVVTVAAKIILPFIPRMLEGLTAATRPVLGTELASGFAAFTILVLPGLAGFLVWEFKENWRIYRATRPKVLKPIIIGHHGETMSRLMRPGFHSGTIPKLFTKLRRAAWQGDEHGVARAKEGLHHVEEAIEMFVDRQLASILNEAEAFQGTDLAVTHVELGSNRIQIELACPSIADTPATIRIELEAGWLLAGITHPGWIAKLDAGQRRIFTLALAGFYKRAEIDIVREQIEQALATEGGAPLRYGIFDEGLIVFPGDGFQTEVVYNLRSRRVRAKVRGAPYAGDLPSLANRHALFGREPLFWTVWSTAWHHVMQGLEPLRVVGGPPLVRE